jgi:3D (Asp-Asp-Asp) domain-containing protein
MRDHRKLIAAGAVLAVATWVVLRFAGPVRIFQGPVAVFEMVATAYSIDGLTKSGVPAQSGVVAADTKVLPLGTRIRVNSAGAPLGEFIVGDTGRAIRGNRIDIYMDRTREAVVFGRKDVVVEVLAWGEGAESVHEHFDAED